MSNHPTRSHTRRPAALAVLTALALTASAARASTPPDQCFTDWSDAVPVVQREALTAVRDLHVLARQRNMGDVVRITLCAEQGRFVYRLMVREPQGRVVPMTVDARRPFQP